MKKNQNLLSFGVILERLWKKYRKIFVFFVICAGVILAIFVSKNFLEQRKLRKTGEIFAEISKNPTDPKNTALLEALSAENPDLYALVLLSKYSDNEKKLQEISALPVNDFVKNYARYQLAVIQKNPENLAKIDGNFADFAILLRGFLLISNGENAAGHEALQNITAKSQLKDLANLLSHYAPKNEKK